MADGVVGERTQVVLAAADCFQRGDWDGMAELYSHDSVMTALENWPESGPFAGREDVVRQFHRLREGFGVSELTLHRHEERGDWVILRYGWATEGAGSGIPQQVEFTAAIRVEANLICEAHYRFDHEAALANIPDA